MKFCHDFYFLERFGHIGILDHLFDKHFIHKGDNIYGIRDDEERVISILVDETLLVRGFFDVDDKDEHAKHINEFWYDGKAYNYKDELELLRNEVEKDLWFVEDRTRSEICKEIAQKIRIEFNDDEIISYCMIPSDNVLSYWSEVRFTTTNIEITQVTDRSEFLC